MRPFTRGPQVFLAGHTHAGQIRIPGIGAVRSPVRWDFGPLIGGPADEWFPELRGIQVTGVRTANGQTVEITPGLGTTSVPLRLFNPAELTVLRLVPAQ
jgi:predicted MPP superfamily phosphohydrolase